MRVQSTRSQAELKAGISGSEAREAEEAFFRQHSHFKGCDPKLFGVTNLTTRSERVKSVVYMGALRERDDPQHCVALGRVSVDSCRELRSVSRPCRTLRTSYDFTHPW